MRADLQAAHLSAKRRWPPVLLVAVLIVVTTVALWKADVRTENRLPVGGHDFIAYWSAYDVSIHGGNPYDADVLADAQRSIPSQEDRTEAQRYWNPPWSLVLLAPVLALPFDVATALWFSLTMLGGVLAVVLAWRLFVPSVEAPPPLALAGSLLFLPFVESLQLGQMTVLVTVLVLGGFLALREGHEVAAGALLALTIVKPQAAFLALAVVALHLVATRRWITIRTGALTAVVVVALSWFLHPAAWDGWDVGRGSPTHWHSATVAAWLRSWLPGDGAPSRWPLVAVPVLTLMALLAWAWPRREEMRWEELPTVLAVSVLMAPFAWLADSVLLFPIQVVVMGAVVQGRRRARVGLAAVAGSQVAVLAVRSLEDTGQHHLVLVPLSFLAIALCMPASWVATAGK